MHIFARWVVKLVRKPESGDASHVPLTTYHATPCVLELSLFLLTIQLRLKTYVASHV